MRTIRGSKNVFGRAIVLVGAIGTGGCGADTVDGTPSTPGAKGGQGGKADAIDYANDPARFDRNLERRFDRLPPKGEARNIPWAGDYWSSARDSINIRWDGSEPSPAEKYAKAFGKAGVPDEVSRYVGKKSSTEEIPGWVGICEGWSAAAIRELPPQKPVEKNGVTFYPGDLQGLVTLLYARGNSDSKFLSRRCNDENARFDANGRALDAGCRDTNPGTLHIIAANYLGIKREAFVEDRTYDAQVWNQPVRGYEITKQREISKDEANALTGGDTSGGTTTTLLAETTFAKGVQKTGEATVPASGILYLNTAGDGDVDLFVNVGAPASETKYTCKSTGGDSKESCTVREAAGTKVSWMLLGYAETSKASLTMTAPQSNAAYAFNPDAKRFVEVEMDLKYISEAGPSRTSNVAEIDSYTRTDHYHYVLELATDGTILGGEYVGDTRRLHPDFLWLPTGAPLGEVAGISYDDVKALLEESRR